MKFLKNTLPYITVALLVVVLGFLNYKPETILTGWDNLHPEFNLALNIKRSFFAVWQEYQSLGLLGGMGHASDIVRQVFLLLISSFVPANFMRFFWTMLTLFIGGAGAVKLSRTIIENSFLGKNKLNMAVLPLFTGLFYILNLATIQSYYTPFETFTAHFAFLPWMILVSLHFFNRQSIKNALLLLTVFFLTTPQSYVPTLFVVFTLSMTVILATAGIRLVKEGRIKKLLTMSIKYYAILFISNAFWLLSFLYFTFTNASTNVNAKINQMATEQIIYQNKEFGTLLDVIFLKGFWFNAIEPNLSRIPTYIMDPWRIHLTNPLVTTIGFLLFGLIIVGLVQAIRKKEILLISFAVLFFLVFSLLCSEVFPFSLIGTLFSNIPLFSQAFRFPFTKLSLLAGLLYSLFATVGLGTTIVLIKKRMFQAITISFLLFALFFYMLPIFQGHLFYEKEQISQPKEYSQVFSYFKDKPSDKRIATLPMHTFWSWNYYSWGYGGSGFLWYGLKQPIVDRAFDVWSKTSENSYNELSQALYSKDSKAFYDVLQKFEISYLILDKSVYSNNSPKSLFHKETEELLENAQGIKKEANYGSITIYSVNLKKPIKNFVSTTPLLPSSNSVDFNNQDTAYKNLGNYKSEALPSNYYPFASLYTNKIKKESFSVTEKDNSVTLSNRLPKMDSFTLTLPDLKSEKIVGVKIINQYNPVTGTSLVSAQILQPTVTVNDKTVSTDEKILYPLFVAPTNTLYSLAINNIRVTDINIGKENELLTYLQLDNDNYFTLTDQNSGEIYVQTIPKDYLLQLPALNKKLVKLENVSGGSTLSVTFPKISDKFYGYSFGGKDFGKVFDCNDTRYGSNINSESSNSLLIKSVNDSACTAVNAPTLPHEFGYLVTVKSKNLSGRSLHFWALNDNQGTTPLDLYLDRKTDNSSFVIAPSKTSGVGYSFHFDNISVGNIKVENSLSKVDVVRIPYSFLTQIEFSKPFITYNTQIDFDSTHPNESLYVVTASNKTKKPFSLILGQSYDDGWKAYQINFKFEILNFKLWEALPFVFGKEIKTHTKINNWANGWEIEGGDVVIIYLPQYLQYAGFGMLAIVALTLLILWVNRSSRYFNHQTNILKTKISLILNS